MCDWIGVEFLVVVLPGILFAGFLITYVISVADGDVYPYFPYISDTGNGLPERGIFSLICNASSFLVLIIAFIRFLHYHQHFRSFMSRSSNYLNVFSFLLGVVCAIGFMIIGCFQSDAVMEVGTVHTIGAVAVFFAGMLYMFIQTFLSYQLVSACLTKYIGRWTLLLRTSCCLLVIVCAIITLVTAIVEVSEISEDDGSGQKHQLISYVISAAGEWATGILLILFILLFHPDFIQLKVSLVVTPRQLGSRGSVTETSPLIH